MVLLDFCSSQDIKFSVFSKGLDMKMKLNAQGYNYYEKSTN